MGAFYPLYIRRSDGQRDVTNHHKRKEKNEPTPEQLDRTPDASGVSDYYREVAIDEPKHLDWRRKLGGMLARDLGHDPEKGFMLVTFPENYKLWEHVKTAGPEKQGAKATKTHAGGGFERQDAYLYGHPMGRKKRFRSPGDFYLHLYWLATDEAGDSDNCACKICTPEELEEFKTAAQPQKEVKPEVKEPVLRREPVVVIPPRQNPAYTTTATASAQNTQPRSLPQLRSPDQATDLAYGSFIFRAGELVWFSRGHAWGLGLITSRWVERTAQSSAGVRKYKIQPLSHPYGHPVQSTVTGDESLRPWLAWSVPGFTCDGLNKVTTTYDTVDWTAVFQHKFGAGDFEVDGSILAAKSVDATYTTFDLISRSEPTQGVHEIRYNGIYLGAEKLWVGDIARLRTGTGSELAVVTSIIERSRHSAFNNQLLEQTLVIIGDVYGPVAQSTVSAQVPLPSGCPPRLAEDLRRRAALTSTHGKKAITYALTRSSAQITTREIKGRWYEPTTLLPILNPQSWATESAKGDIPETGTKMNARLDCNSVRGQTAAVEERRKGDRVEAFGKSVPTGLRLTDMATEQSQGQSQAPAVVSVSKAEAPAPNDAGAELDEFMNLDNIGDDNMGFTEGYGGQSFA